MLLKIQNVMVMGHPRFANELSFKELSFRRNCWKHSSSLAFNKMWAGEKGAGVTWRISFGYRAYLFGFISQSGGTVSMSGVKWAR